MKEEHENISEGWKSLEDFNIFNASFTDFSEFFSNIFGAQKRREKFPLPSNSNVRVIKL